MAEAGEDLGDARERAAEHGAVEAVVGVVEIPDAGVEVLLLDQGANEGQLGGRPERHDVLARQLGPDVRLDGGAKRFEVEGLGVDEGAVQIEEDGGRPSLPVPGGAQRRLLPAAAGHGRTTRSDARTIAAPR